MGVLGNLRISPPASACDLISGFLVNGVLPLIFYDIPDNNE